MPPVQTALDLYHMLSESDTNLRQPIGLESQLLQNSLGSEVGQSMLQLLQVWHQPLPYCPDTKFPSVIFQHKLATGSLTASFNTPFFG